MPTDGCGHRLAWLSLTPIAVRSGRINRSRSGSVLPQTVKEFAGLISYIRPKLLGDSGPHFFAATGDRSFIDGSLLPASERSRRMLRRSSSYVFASVIYIPCRLAKLGFEAGGPLDPLWEPTRFSMAVFDLVSPYSIIIRMKADAK